MENKTLHLTVIGDPIEHSISPKIQNELASKAGVSIEYTRTKVNETSIKEFTDFAKNNLDGFNVTMPCKKIIIPFLDTVEAGFDAVNTVKVVGGKMHGFNTDASGFIASLKPLDFSSKKVVIYGKGGAASAIGSKFRDTKYLYRDEIYNYNFENIDLFINAAPLGMKGRDIDFKNLDFLKTFKQEAVIYDIVYNPSSTTKLINEAKVLGLKTFEGIDLLKAQAIDAFKIFTS